VTVFELPPNNLTNPGSRITRNFMRSCLAKGAIVITFVHTIDKNTKGFKTGSFLYCAEKEITKH
jgi:hypothetical protein